MKLGIAIVRARITMTERIGLLNIVVITDGFARIVDEQLVED